MTTETILKYYWDIFLPIICEFYPFDKDFISKYKYELDWDAISKNRQLTWDLAFLEQYEERFTWHELACNDAILWEEAKIDRFKKRLDWGFLGRNKSLPITEQFITKYLKRLFVSDNNPLLTQDLIKKFNLRVLPSKDFFNEGTQTYKDGDLERMLNEARFYFHRKVIFDRVFMPILKARSIEQLFANKFDYTQRYYFLKPIHKDIHGLVPSFRVKDIDRPIIFQEEQGLVDFEKPLTIIKGHYQEGPDRLYEVPDLYYWSFFAPLLLVSENVKNLLEQFKLPNHKYHEVIIESKKLIPKSKFYILQLEFDTLNKDLVYEKQVFHSSYKGSSSRHYGIVDTKISNRTELLAAIKNLNQKLSIYSGADIKAEAYNLKTDFDLYSSPSEDCIIINQYLKEALEKNFPKQMHFKSAQLLNIKIEQAKYDAKKSPSTPSVNPELNLSYELPQEDIYYFEKAERLANHDAPLDKALIETGPFHDIELNLNVIFPASFKQDYINKRIQLDDYNVLPISGFYIQDEYAPQYPETFKSVVIAENIYGDSINLILERDSDYQLQYKLFQFLHETGDYEAIE